jgi:hypothetical protein
MIIKIVRESVAAFRASLPSCQLLCLGVAEEPTGRLV